MRYPCLALAGDADEEGEGGGEAGDDDGREEGKAGEVGCTMMMMWIKSEVMLSVRTGVASPASLKRNTTMSLPRCLFLATCCGSSCDCGSSVDTWYMISRHPNVVNTECSPVVCEVTSRPARNPLWPARGILSPSSCRNWSKAGDPASLENHSSSVTCPGFEYSTPNLKVLGICPASHLARSSTSPSDVAFVNLPRASTGLVARSSLAGDSLPSA